MVTAVTVTNSADKNLAVWIKKRIFAPHNNKKTMTDKKEQTMLELASDDSAMQLLRSIAHNWEVAASRMEQINQERDQALYDDDGVEVMAVFCRLERVGSMMFSMLSHPQALLLRGFHQQIVKMAADHRLDRELVTMMGSQSEGLSIGVPTLWKRLKDIFDKGVKETDEGMATVQSLYQQHYIPHMDAEQALRAMESVVKRDEDDEQLAQQLEFMDDMVDFGENIGKVAAFSKNKMAVGLAVIQMAVKLFVDYTDLQLKEDEAVDALFEEAKAELLNSEAWKNYWRSHLSHLALMGSDTSLADELKKDAEEVERYLLSMHGYIYNRWDESPEAFGSALKESDMSDDEMLRLLFYLAKKQALEDEGETPDNRLLRMRSSVKEKAERIKDLSDDKYYDAYESIWEDIVQNPILGDQLAKYRNGKHNSGFNMQCFCQIVGWLNREKHFYGSNSPSDLGKKLGDKHSWETYRDYIKKTKTTLTDQSIKELESILGKHSKK